MTRYRLEISKGEGVRFISHLDLMKAFERSLRRAEIPVAFSEGFNPHPKITFGTALAVGVTSQCELVDIELKEELPESELQSRIAAALPEPIKLDGVHIVDEKLPALMAVIHSSEYVVTVEISEGNRVTQETLNDLVEKILRQEKVIVEKRTKKGLREVDIRPGILALTGQAVDSLINFTMTLQTGSVGNVRPEDVLAGLSDMGLPIERTWARIHRTRLFGA